VTTAARSAQTRRPNVLFILVDDMGQRALSCYGNPHVQTRNVDRLASEGMRFTDAYVTPQCTPTRASILTGQYTARNKMWHVIPWYGTPWGRVAEPRYREQLPRDSYLLSKGLKAAGYATACIGKWHLTTNDDGHYLWLNQPASQHYGFDVTATPSKVKDEFSTGDKGVDRLTGESLEFIERNRNRPWFCYLSHHTIHNRVSAPSDLIQKYRERGFPEKGLHNATYLAAIEHLDTSVGRLMTGLRDMKLDDNTAVFFLTDNGGIQQALSPKPERDADGVWRLSVADEQFGNQPLREGKGYAYEGGIRVPMIVRWPGMIRGGGVERMPVHGVDLMPTILEMAGTRAPANHVQDGVSLGPLLTGRGSLPERDLFWHMPLYDIRWAGTPCAVIRSGQWKLIEYFGDWFDKERRLRFGNRLELFDLEQDLGEQETLTKRHGARALEMKARLHAWIQSCGEAVPSLNPHFDPSRALEETKVKQAWN
jgi:uncharacterized sulfatase